MLTGGGPHTLVACLVIWHVFVSIYTVQLASVQSATVITTGDSQSLFIHYLQQQFCLSFEQEDEMVDAYLNNCMCCSKCSKAIVVCTFMH